MENKRYVILEFKQGDCLETILPLDTTLDKAKDMARKERQRVSANQVKTLIELAVMDCEDGEPDYSQYDTIDYEGDEE